jgi:hypothetical protein
VYFACHGFELAGARQTVRDLTFEYTWHGLFVGCCFPADEEALESGGVGPLRSQPGGHLIESNTFRYTPNGLRVIGESAVERVPSTNYPGDAINILPFSSMLDLLQSPEEDHTSCSGNIIARNRIEGYPDGIRILLPDPETSCRRNEIRDNTIIAGRARWIDIENGPGSPTPLRLPEHVVRAHRIPPIGAGDDADPRRQCGQRDEPRRDPTPLVRFHRYRRRHASASTICLFHPRPSFQPLGLDHP